MIFMNFSGKSDADIFLKCVLIYTGKNQAGFAQVKHILHNRSKYVYRKTPNKNIYRSYTK